MPSKTPGVHFPELSGKVSGGALRGKKCTLLPRALSFPPHIDDKRPSTATNLLGPGPFDISHCPFPKLQRTNPDRTNQSDHLAPHHE